ncbi:MAG TPA: hypothetical protein VFN55_18755 [Solirubrobacteraceae bacterium]|nr:hypothetical protein [Solirubrobacteraceae bacterium]
MDAGWLHRLRWRRSGAWLWPTFVVLTVLDGVFVHARPMVGDGQNLVGGVVIAMVFNVIAILLLARPLGALVHRRRRDMPPVVARDYGGTLGVALVTALMVTAGLVHHGALAGERSTLRDAIARAEAYVGDHAPAPFRLMAAHTDTFTIQAGQVYRTCVPNPAGTRTYCVIVRPRLPLQRSVTFDGYEPNAVFSEGVN